MLMKIPRQSIGLIMEERPPPCHNPIDLSHKSANRIRGRSLATPRNLNFKRSDSMNIQNFPPKSEEEISKIQAFINALTRADVTSEETFEIVSNTNGDELLKEKLMQELRQRAVMLGMRATAFDSQRRAFEQNVKAKRKSQQAKKANNPDWWSEDGIDEGIFCELYAGKKKIRFFNHHFYSPDGFVDEAIIRSEIQRAITPFLKKNLAKETASLLQALRSYCYTEPPKLDIHSIHVMNGKIKFQSDGSYTFTEEMQFCINRLAIEYNPSAAVPQLFMNYLHDLLSDEDIPTLQEYLGYCLLPITKAQKMLFIIGKGGEGKSIIGYLMLKILGKDNAVTGKLGRLDSNPFSVANMSDKLLLIDDDMETRAAAESAKVKEIVTCMGTMELERKGEQAYQGNMYCRIIAFGNQPYQTLYDPSDGAFRRRIILTAKPKPEGRKDDRDLPQKLLQEKAGIFLWMLDGLQRLIRNKFEFTISAQAKANLEQSRKNTCNIESFLMDDSVIQIGDPSTMEHSKDIFEAYQKWCTDNSTTPSTHNSVSRYLNQNLEQLHISNSENIYKNGLRARGYIGIHLVQYEDRSDDTDLPY